MSTIINRNLKDQSYTAVTRLLTLMNPLLTASAIMPLSTIKNRNLTDPSYTAVARLLTLMNPVLTASAINT